MEKLVEDMGQIQSVCVCVGGGGEGELHQSLHLADKSLVDKETTLGQGSCFGLFVCLPACLFCLC